MEKFHPFWKKNCQYLLKLNIYIPYEAITPLLVYMWSVYTHSWEDMIKICTATTLRIIQNLGQPRCFIHHLQKHENINCSLVNENTQFHNEITLKYMTPTKMFEWKEHRLYDFKYMLFKDKQNYALRSQDSNYSWETCWF